jgi:hypothetical protein
MERKKRGGFSRPPRQLYPQEERGISTPQSIDYSPQRGNVCGLSHESSPLLPNPHQTLSNSSIYENHHARVQASVTDARDANKRMVHTAVPITDESGVNVNRLFICSEKPDERAEPAG